VCQEPGSASEIGGKYLGSLQQYVNDTGNKGSVPELCFNIGYLLEDLGQYRNANRVRPVSGVSSDEDKRCAEDAAVEISLLHPMRVPNRSLTGAILTVSGDHTLVGTNTNRMYPSKQRAWTPGSNLSHI
jgi:hypothetical protein